jgi:glycosyltransferase involved in cell wall biosynthesis
VSKIIFTAHGWAFNEDRDAFSKLVIKFFAWLTIIFNHKVIAVSKNIKEQVRNWPFVSSKIEVIYSGLGKIDFKAREEARALLLGPEFPENKLLTGNIAELHPIKGQKYLIEALALLKETDFTSVIIGEGEERENLEKLINQNNLENKVKLVGHIDQAPTYLKAFDIFVFPSLSEALGYAALEAGAAGLPVIASRVGGIPEIIDNLESGLLIAPRRPDEIKNALLYLINHREERKKFGENLQKKVTEKFSLKRMVQETKKLYLED